MKARQTTPQNKCGGKSSGCAVEFELPKGITPHKVTDKGKTQSEGSGGQTQSTSK